MCYLQQLAGHIFHALGFIHMQAVKIKQRVRLRVYVRPPLQVSFGRNQALSACW